LILLGNGLILNIQLEDVVALFGSRLPLRLGDGIIHRRWYCEAISVLARLFFTLLGEWRDGGGVENVLGCPVQ
jgi:hypothetical protein